MSETQPTNPATTAPAAPVAGTPEYDQAMAARFDAAQQTTPTETTPNPERPAWLPEKFQSPEDLAKAYSELEKKIGQPKQEEPPKATEEKPAEGQKTEAEKTVEKAGLDYSALQDEFHKTGALSAETFTKLEAAGIPKGMVEDYIKGQVAIANQLTSEVHTAAGGKESYEGMLKWAATGLSAGEQEAFNKAMDYGTIDEIRLAVSGLAAKFSAANGSEPKLLGGTNTVAVGDVFRSNAELIQAMSDPRYAKDEAYREDIKQKLARSNIM